jgi:hypothetical protein
MSLSPFWGADNFWWPKVAVPSPAPHLPNGSERWRHFGAWMPSGMNQKRASFCMIYLHPPT